MSYIITDPVYHQKPTFKFRRPKMIKKNLFDNFDEDDSLSPPDDAIKVFLRLKPTITTSDVIQVLDSRTLLFKMPQEFMQARNKLNMSDQYKYSFSHIYQPDTTQSQIYTGCVAPLIKDLFNGQHCLLFTYGTTNAGKTFTVLGNGDNPGIIPRTLSSLFKSISGKECTNDRIMPDKFNSAIEVTDNTLSEERKFKEGILTWKVAQLDSKLHKTNSTVRSSVDEIFGESVFKEMQKRLTNDTSIVEYSTDSDDRFSVWVSFAEVYNEAIYDLLQPVGLTASTKRKQLKLGQDNNKNYYIKGLKQIFVQSEEEAYKVLMFGKTNLQVAATGMNSRSSRSHCIFTIKLIKSPNVEHPERVVVSSFSICDLAGAERQKKTLNVGLRLKESQNINCSLHVLSRCFTIIRENQLNMEQKMIPFRDSKLTQLFKHALTGKENVTMIVNVNPDHQLCEETQHVLKASAIAKHIVVQPRKKPKRETRPPSMFMQMVRHNRSTLIPWDSCVKRKELEQGVDAISVIEEENKNEREEKQEQYESLLSLIEELKEKLTDEKARYNELKRNWRLKEEEIRNEVKEELTQFLEMTKQQEQSVNKRIEEANEEYTNGKKRRLLSPEEHIVKQKSYHCDEAADKSMEVQDLKEEVRMQQKQIDGLTDLVNILRDEKKELGMELALARLNLSHRERDIENLKGKIEMFGEKSTLHEKYLQLEKEMEAKLASRDQLLNEVKEDLLAELREKDDLEEEITKLEKELHEKEEEMLNHIEDLNEKISDREDQIEFFHAKTENMEYLHEQELNSLKQKIASMEEEIVRLNQAEDKGLAYNVKQMKEQAEGYSTLKQETTERFANLAKIHDENMSKLVEDFEQKIKARDQEIQKLNKETEATLHRLENVKEDLQTKIEEAELLKSNLEKKEKNYNLLKEKMESEISKLTCRLEESDKISVVTSELKVKCQTLLETLAKKSEEIDLLQKTVDTLANDKKAIEEEYRSEISTLEQSCKEQLKETTRLWDSQKEMSSENQNLSKELSKLKKIVDNLNKSLKVKEHELECCRSKMMGYEKIVPTLQSEFDMQRKELLEYKTRCEDQQETIINMEKELGSFQMNQKEIIGKYEENLKKTKEENETLKKEVARVTNAFYKSTPTPKKVLEKQLDEQKTQIEDLRKQLEEKETQCGKILEEKETLISQLHMQTSTEGPNKENESILNAKGGKPKGKTTKSCLPSDVRRRAMSCEEDHYSSSDMDNRAKSASKTRTRRQTRATAVPTVVVTEESKPKMQPRKKLWDATIDGEEQFEDDEKDLNIPQDSPGTYYRRNLRTRNK